MTKYNQYAEIGQDSIDFYFRAEDDQQFVNNVYPVLNEQDNQVFNYWWLAHLVDVRIDAAYRTGNPIYIQKAERTFRYNKSRNHGTLLHEYYDDMLWNGLAALRLFEITNKREYVDDAVAVCDDIFETGWNDSMNGGFAWKRTQPNYKNTPVNAPIMILALRLYRLTHDSKYLDTSIKTLEWMKKMLVNPIDLFVEDGINRNNDGKVDNQWQFTYNQGVYIGALIEFYHVTGDESYLNDALQCAKTSLSRLVKDGVFIDAGDGGDVGLFKGIEYRYLAQLYLETKDQSIRDFILSSCDVLIKSRAKDGKILAYRDWLVKKNPSQIYLSDELSAVMALESAVIVE